MSVEVCALVILFAYLFCEVAKAQSTISLSQNVLSAVLMDYAFINVSICQKEGKNGNVYFPDHFLHFMEFPLCTKKTL